MRLIDADELLNKCYHAYPSIDHYCTSRSVVDTKDVIHAPTIDAVPVKHGRWVVSDWYPPTCSVCNLAPPTPGYVENANFYERYFKHCPGCGAKMDEVSE